MAPLFDSRDIHREQISIETISAFNDARLRDIVVYSSHNSYIRTFQIGSEANTEAIHIALAKGARCLELDIFREPDAPTDVFVAHGQQNADGGKADLLGTTKLPLREALAFIAANAWTTTSNPLFLALEVNVHDDTVACDAISDIITSTFSPERLLPPGEKITPSTPVRSLLNKVVFLTGGGIPPSSKLNNQINVVWSADFQNAPHKNTQETLLFTQSVVRIYPAGDVNGTLSLNFDPLPFLQKGATFVSMNVCTNDAHMRSYDEYFGKSSILLSR
jgi:hypothetical protein